MNPKITNDGFSLLESFVSLTILAICLLSVLGQITHAYRFFQDWQIRVDVGALLIQEIYRDIHESAAPVSSQREMNLSGIQVSVIHDQRPMTQIPGFRELRVECRWEVPAHRTKEIKIIIPDLYR